MNPWAIAFAMIAWAGGMLVSALSMFYQCRILKTEKPGDRLKLIADMKGAAIGVTVAAFVLVVIALTIWFIYYSC